MGRSIRGGATEISNLVGSHAIYGFWCRWLRREESCFAFGSRRSRGAHAGQRAAVGFHNRPGACDLLHWGNRQRLSYQTIQSGGSTCFTYFASSRKLHLQFIGLYVVGAHVRRAAVNCRNICVPGINRKHLGFLQSFETLWRVDCFELWCREHSSSSSCVCGQFG